MWLNNVLYWEFWVQLLHKSKELEHEWSVTLLVLLLLQMWKASAGHTVSVSQDDGADDWETDPDFVVWLLGLPDPPGACSGTVPEELCGVGDVSWPNKLSGACPCSGGEVKLLFSHLWSQGLLEAFAVSSEMCGTSDFFGVLTLFLCVLHRMM